LQLREVSDAIYGTIPLYYPLNLIIDTSEFQRLRRLKQTGVLAFVFPGAEHSRFTHCLGVYHLASTFVKSLADRLNLNISSRDQLCVAIAGLCHDIGSWFLYFPVLYHEEATVQLFRRICSNSKLKKELDDFLEPEDYIFIEELISPPKKKFNENGHWICKGRPAEKSYLYDIICNNNDSFDVDKYDYILRDATFTGMGLAMNLNTVRRIINGAMPLEAADKFGNKCLRLCYAYKVFNELQSVAESRYHLHSSVYNQKAVCACEYLTVQAFKAAARFIKFIGDDGKEYDLGHVTENLGAFLQCDDGVFDEILRSRSEELRVARNYVDCLIHRRLPKYVAAVEIRDGEIAEKWTDESRWLHCGMGISKSPLSEVYMYDQKSFVPKPYRARDQWLKDNPRYLAGNFTVTAFVSFEAYENQREIIEAVYKAFSSVFGNGDYIAPVMH
uniref:HD domain-containing protein n=1 Tax=Enterobius vermicularis TaxID=51028 RepID=A0A0N4UVN3_ENTVE